MKTITQKDKIQQLVDMGNEPKNSTVKHYWLKHHFELAELATEKDVTKNDVVKIWGKYYTDNLLLTECNECKSLVNAVVQLGDMPDYESSTAWICKICLIEALKKF